MARQLRIDDPELTRQAEGVDVIIIGNRTFVLMDVAAISSVGADLYQPTPEEAEMLREAAVDPRPHLSGMDVDAYMRRRRRELGLDG
jgi:hypothetical protein